MIVWLSNQLAEIEISFKHGEVKSSYILIRTNRVMELEEESECLINGEEKNLNNAVKSTQTPLLALSSVVSLCGSLSVGYAAGFSSPIESEIMQDLGLSISEYTKFGSMLTIGGIIGAVVNGKVADQFGRRGAMWFGDILSTAGWLAIAFAKDSWGLNLGRLLSGFSSGIVSFVVPVCLAEIAPKDMRGLIASANQLLLCSGISLVYFMGIIVRWRPLALIGAIHCVVQALGLIFTPESPRWLTKFGEEDDFEVSLQRLRGKTANISVEAAEIRNFPETAEQHSKSAFWEMSQTRYAHSLIGGLGLLCLKQFGGAKALSYYASSIFEAAGFSSSIGTMAIAIIQVIHKEQVLAAALGVVLTDKCGRRPLLMWSASGLCLCCFLVGLSFCLQQIIPFNKITLPLVLLEVLGYILCYQAGMGGVPWLIVLEIYPINIKGSAGSLATTSYWICSWIVAYTYNMMTEWSLPATFFIYASACDSTVVFVAKLVPETKARTLEAIQTPIFTPTRN